MLKNNSKNKVHYILPFVVNIAMPILAVIDLIIFFVFNKVITLPFCFLSVKYVSCYAIGAFLSVIGIVAGLYLIFTFSVFILSGIDFLKMKSRFIFSYLSLLIPVIDLIYIVFLIIDDKEHFYLSYYLPYLIIDALVIAIILYFIISKKKYLKNTK